MTDATTNAIRFESDRSSGRVEVELDQIVGSASKFHVSFGVDDGRAVITDVYFKGTDGSSKQRSIELETQGSIIDTARATLEEWDYDVELAGPLTFE